MQRVGRTLAAVVFALGVLAAPAAFAFGGHGSFGGRGFGGFHRGFGGFGGFGWGYAPYFDYGDPYDYGYGYGYPPPPPALSPYCATGTQICVLRQPRDIGSGCSCRGAGGVISGPPE